MALMKDIISLKMGSPLGKKRLATNSEPGYLCWYKGCQSTSSFLHKTKSVYKPLTGSYLQLTSKITVQILGQETAFGTALQLNAAENYQIGATETSRPCYYSLLVRQPRLHVISITLECFCTGTIRSFPKERLAETCRNRPTFNKPTEPGNFIKLRLKIIQNFVIEFKSCINLELWL